MSRSASSSPRLAVVGNPANRRIGLFQDAVRAAGLPRARTVPWLDALEGKADFLPGETVRIESPGEDPEVDRLLRGVDDPARVEGSALWYARFTSAVRDVSRAATAAGAVLLDTPGDIAVLFDKRRCHGVLDAAGVPVPASPTSGPGAPPVRGWADVRALMADHRLPRVFVKLAHGSSASGVMAVETAGAGRIRAATSVERDPAGRLYNSSGSAASRPSARWRRSSTHSRRTVCTSNAGCRRPRSGAGPRICGSWWSTAVRRTPSCAPAAPP